MDWLDWRGLVGFLVLSGLCHFASFNHHRQYHFIKEPKTWPEARKYCREKYTELATINNEQDLKELADLVESNVSYIFLGLYRSWGWSLSDTDDYKEGELAYWNWASGEPIKTNLCGSIGETGEWFAMNCANNLNFSCYNGSKTDLSERFTLVKGIGNWFFGQAYCREWHTDLPRVRNQLENEELQRRVTEDRVWIGLTRMSWLWSDGTVPSFTPWSLLEPLINGLSDCAMLDVKSQPLGMIDRSCAETWPFFCYSDTKRKHVVRLKLNADDSSVDITDPAVMESIGNWVERQLSNKAATTDVKLRWKKLPEKEKKTKEQTEILEEVCVP